MTELDPVINPALRALHAIIDDAPRSSPHHALDVAVILCLLLTEETDLVITLADAVVDEIELQMDPGQLETFRVMRQSVVARIKNAVLDPMALMVDFWDNAYEDGTTDFAALVAEGRRQFAAYETASEPPNV